MAKTISDLENAVSAFRRMRYLERELEQQTERVGKRASALSKEDFAKYVEATEAIRKKQDADSASKQEALEHIAAIREKAPSWPS